jgi:hypothetical protein
VSPEDVTTIIADCRVTPRLYLAQSVASPYLPKDRAAVNLLVVRGICSISSLPVFILTSFHGKLFEKPTRPYIEMGRLVKQISVDTCQHSKYPNTRFGC